MMHETSSTDLPPESGRLGWGLRWKLLLSVGAVLTVTLVLVSLARTFGIPFTDYSGSFGRQRAAALSGLGQLADLKRDQFIQWLNERRDFAEALSNAHVLRSAISRLKRDIPLDADGIPGQEMKERLEQHPVFKELARHLRQSAAASRSYARIWAADLTSGVIVGSTDQNDVGRRLTDREMMTAVVSSIHRGYVAIEKGTHQPRNNLIICNTISGRSQLEYEEAADIAAVFIALDSEELMVPLLQTRGTLGESGEIIIVDADLRLASSSRTKPPAEQGTYGESRILWTPAELAVQGHEGIVMDTDHQGVPVLAAYRHLRVSPMEGWGLVVKRHQSEVFGPLWDEVILSSVVSVAGLICAGFLISVLAHRISQPVENLSKTAEAVQKGDLTVRAPVSGTDELAILAVGFNTMVEKIQRWHEDLETQVRSRTRALEQLNSELEEEITERERVQLALEESEQRLMLAMESSNEGLWDFDTRLNTVLRSPRFYTMLGYEPGEFPPGLDGWKSKVHPDDLPQVLEALEDYLGGRRSDYEVEFRMVAKSGDPRWILSRGKVVERDGEGNPVRMVGTHTDVTDKKNAEEALRQSEKLYRTLFERAGDAIFILDAEEHAAGRIVAANPAACRMHGYTETELLDMSISDLDAPEDRHRISERMTRMLAGEWVTGEVTHIRKDGAVLPMEISAGLIMIGDHKYVLAIDRDVTERKKAHELLLQTERIKAVGEMAGGVAHNFNNLLQIVEGASEMGLAYIQRANLAEVKSCFEKILASSRMGAQTVKRLQDFARVRNDDPVSGGTVFDLAKTAQQAIEMSKPLWKTAAEREGLSITVNHHLDEDCLVLGKENELFEVLLNLIKNATEALPGDGEINVSCRLEAGKVVLKVQDDGVGIAREHLGNVFEPFWTSKGFRGTGMGLASSYGIVARHGGGISVESAVGKGAVFSVTLPAARRPLEEKDAVPEEKSPATYRILVVDDMRPVAELIAVTFTRRKQTVFMALSGEEALRVFEKEPVDAVICDLGMPDMNGWQVGKAIKEKCEAAGIKKPPFILVTGWGGQIGEKEMMAESGVDAVFEKPVDTRKLLQAIGELLQAPAPKSDI